MALLAFQAHTRHRRGPVEGTHSSQDRERPKQTQAAQPKLEVRERGVALRMRVERWPAPADGSDDDALVEAGYGHGV